MRTGFAISAASADKRQTVEAATAAQTKLRFIIEAPEEVLVVNRPTMVGVLVRKSDRTGSKTRVEQPLAGQAKPHEVRSALLVVNFGLRHAKSESALLIDADVVDQELLRERRLCIRCSDKVTTDRQVQKQMESLIKRSRKFTVV